MRDACLTLWEIAEDPDAFMARKAALLRVFLICLAMSLLRHNAVFAVLPAVLAVIILCRGACKSRGALRRDDALLLRRAPLLCNTRPTPRRCSAPS